MSGEERIIIFMMVDVGAADCNGAGRLAQDETTSVSVNYEVTKDLDSSNAFEGALQFDPDSF